MKKSTIRTEKRPKKFRFFGRTQYCLTNTRLSGVLFFVQNKKNDCKTLSFVYIIKTECGIPRCSQQTEEEHRMNEKTLPCLPSGKAVMRDQESHRAAPSCTGSETACATTLFAPPDARYRKSAGRGSVDYAERLDHKNHS